MDTLTIPDTWNSRTEALIGPQGCKRLESAHVLVAGVGGVGGYVAELLARSGVGNLTLVDADCISLSNLNRQLIALTDNLGEGKAMAFARRIASINPACKVNVIHEFLTSENIPAVLTRGYGYVADCIDTVAPKVALIGECSRRRIPLISSMGAGGLLDPSRVKYADLWETREDGLARAVRNNLKKSGYRPRVDVVYSDEAPHTPPILTRTLPGKRSSYGTVAPIVTTFGAFMAARIINNLK